MIDLSSEWEIWYKKAYAEFGISIDREASILRGLKRIKLVTMLNYR